MSLASLQYTQLLFPAKNARMNAREGDSPDLSFFLYQDKGCVTTQSTTRRAVIMPKTRVIRNTRTLNCQRSVTLAMAGW